MVIEEFKPISPIIADIVVTDADDFPVMLAEVKGGGLVATPEQVTRLLWASLPTVEYIILADMIRTRIFRRDRQNLSEPLAELSTVEILSEYDPNFANKPIQEFYLVTLLEAWLRDVAYHWKNETPPKFDVRKSIGVADWIAGGFTRPEVRLV